MERVYAWDLDGNGKIGTNDFLIVRKPYWVNATRGFYVDRKVAGEEIKGILTKVKWN